jgi:hypothetical protein
MEQERNVNFDTISMAGVSYVVLSSNIQPDDG